MTSGHALGCDIKLAVRAASTKHAAFLARSTLCHDKKALQKDTTAKDHSLKPHPKLTPPCRRENDAARSFICSLFPRLNSVVNDRFVLCDFTGLWCAPQRIRSSWNAALCRRQRFAGSRTGSPRPVAAMLPKSGVVRLSCDGLRDRDLGGRELECGRHPFDYGRLEFLDLDRFAKVVVHPCGEAFFAIAF